jgi:tellurite resistance protein
MIALACKIAWVDGGVSPEERGAIEGLVHRLGAKGMIAADELDGWLSGDADAAARALDGAIEALPPGLDQMFAYEALALMEADGEIDAREQALVEELIARVFRDAPAGTPLAKIALARRDVRRA